VTFVSVVLPSVVNPLGRAARLEAIAGTWGPRARAVFVSHATEEPQRWPAWDSSSSDVLFPRQLMVPAEIPEALGVARLAWVLLQFRERVDFLFLCNDHTFVIAANLECFLTSLPPTPVYLGRALGQRSKEKIIFNSGAAGYVLSRAALRSLDWQRSPDCRVAKTNKWLQGNPGLVLAKCLQASGVTAADTRDASGRHRFHAYGPIRTVTGQVDDWYKRMHENVPFPDYVVKQGLDCCAPDSVSFHYVEAKEQAQLHRALSRPEKTIDDDHQWMQTFWPQKAKDLGGYAKPYPSDSPHQRKDVTTLLFHHLLNNSSVCPPPQAGQTPPAEKTTNSLTRALRRRGDQLHSRGP